MVALVSVFGVGANVAVMVVLGLVAIGSRSQPALAQYELRSQHIVMPPLLRNFLCVMRPTEACVATP